MILVLVQQTGDIQLARALLHALGRRYEWFLLFGKLELKRLMGDVDCHHGFDPAFCLLNPQHFELVVSFSGMRHPRMTMNLTLLSFFNQIGVPTLEIQHGLFQYGINNTDPGLQVGGRVERGDQLGLSVGYGAKHVVPWGGDHGIGYLKSNLPARSSEWRRDYGLITTNSNWHLYAGKQRYQLALAILKLASSLPKQRFVWKPHSAEHGQADAKQAITMVERYELPNLSIDRSTPAEELILRCSFGITTVSTTLLDYERCQKPAIVFTCPEVQHLVERLQVRTFSSGSELPRIVSELVASPHDYLVHTGIGPLDIERLARHFEIALSSRKELACDPLPLALQFLTYLRPPHAEPAEVERVNRGVDRMAKKMGEFQRSTLAYKVKKLVDSIGRRKH